MTDYFDLFGNPDTLPSGRRGRPAHKPTRESRNKVKMLLALGWSNDIIAQALCLSLPTLKKHYFSELRERDAERVRMEAWKFERLFAEAGKGNVGALKELDKQIEKNDRMRAAKAMRDVQSDGEEDHVPAEKIGKKEKARREAAALVNSDDAGDGWDDLIRPGYKH